MYGAAIEKRNVAVKSMNSLELPKPTADPGYHFEVTVWGPVSISNLNSSWQLQHDESIDHRLLISRRRFLTTAPPLSCFHLHPKVNYTVVKTSENWGSELSKNGLTLGINHFLIYI